jgi:hypothetical protein
MYACQKRQERLKDLFRLTLTQASPGDFAWRGVPYFEGLGVVVCSFIDDAVHGDCCKTEVRLSWTGDEEIDRIVEIWMKRLVINRLLLRATSSLYIFCGSPLEYLKYGHLPTVRMQH